MEPAVFVDDLGGGFGILIVAQHHTAAPDADLAGLIQLVLAVAVRLAQRPDMGLCLGVVHQTIAAGLGHAVALGDVHAVFHQTQQHLAVEHGRAAAGVPQAVQLIGAAALDILVDALHQHRGHGNGIAVHQPQIPVEIPQITAKVQGPALEGPGEQADKGAQMEQGQDGKVAQDIVFVLGQLPVLEVQQVVAHGNVHLHHGKEVPLCQHHGLAAAGGAGGEQHDHQGIGVDLLFQPAGRGVLPDIHRPQAFPIRSLQLVTAAVVHPIVQDEGRLCQLQLPAQFIPGLFLVHRYQNSPGQHSAKGIHAVLIAVPAQQDHPLALHLRDVPGKPGSGAADILCILGIGLFLHGAGGILYPAEGHPPGEFLLHCPGDKIIDIVYHGLLLFLPFDFTCAAACPVRCGAGARRCILQRRCACTWAGCGSAR